MRAKDFILELGFRQLPDIVIIFAFFALKHSWKLSPVLVASYSSMAATVQCHYNETIPFLSYFIL